MQQAISLAKTEASHITKCKVPLRTPRSMQGKDEAVNTFQMRGKYEAALGDYFGKNVLKFRLRILGNKSMSQRNPKS